MNDCGFGSRDLEHTATPSHELGAYVRPPVVWLRKIADLNLSKYPATNSICISRTFGPIAVGPFAS